MPALENLGKRLGTFGVRRELVVRGRENECGQGLILLWERNLSGAWGLGFYQHQEMMHFNKYCKLLHDLLGVYRNLRIIGLASEATEDKTTETTISINFFILSLSMGTDHQPLFNIGFFQLC